VVYGERITLNAITELTLTRYSERQIGTIEPAGMRSVERTHTYSFDAGIEALDGCRRVPRFSLRRALRWSPKDGRKANERCPL
jgi:hypothetical protein